MRYFVVMGNTRVGSTWFTTSLNDLPGIFCTRELRWRMPYQDQVPPVHTYIDSTTESIKERLDVGFKIFKPKEISAIGAKLKFDPYGYVPPAAFARLGEVVEDDVEVIFLRRPYFEIYATWKAHGIRHLANPNSAKGARRRKTSEAETITNSRFHKTHSEPLEPKLVLLTRDGEILTPPPQADQPQEHITQSISDAIDDLLVMFYNDVLGLEAMRNHPNVHHIYYEDITRNFHRVARKLVTDVSPEDCNNVLANAATSQIEKDGEQLVFPDAGLREISRYLDGLFGDLRAGKVATSDIVRFDEDKQTVTFNLSGIDDVLAKHEDTRGLAQGESGGPSSIAHRISQSSRVPSPLRSVFRSFSVPRGRGRAWVSYRTIYVPAAVAPKPTTWVSVTAIEPSVAGN
ncbi:MAG: hypothetical protein FJX44_00130 [Alphaproteobacteria bacterium]|nr:hypothetical protein [Alphaproteobacteria bacterium]